MLSLHVQLYLLNTLQGSKDMKRERAIFTERRRAEQKQEADEFMQQHWKINDPGEISLADK